MIPIVTIEGATATGKSSLAIQLAKELKTEIISADSRQVYRYLNIGTAKPTPKELDTVKHHLIDIINPNEIYNAGLYRKHALEIITNLHQKQMLPLIVGGTGLYIKSLLNGLFELNIQDLSLRKELQEQIKKDGLQSLYERLKQIDSDMAIKISSNDKQRIIRALEVYYITCIPLSEHWKKQKASNNLYPFRIYITDDRKKLYSRIDTRVLAMIQAGLLDEISAIINMGYDWDCPAFNSVGYKEFRPFFESNTSLKNCISLAQQHTRNYAKRQFTWYKKINFHLTLIREKIIIDNIKEAIFKFFENH